MTYRRVVACLLTSLLVAVAAGPACAAPPEGADLTSAAAVDTGIPETACDEAVLMVVTGTISDPARMRSYGQAIQAAEIYPATSGYYLHIGQPIDIFEGDYPQGAFTVIAQFPCLEHARAFWYSEAYQAIIPLREGAADVLVRVYRKLEAPAFMRGRLEEARYIAFPPVDAIPRVH
ncbi:MAG: DUF1330 domain-containing protein [Gammaproteobacteria bacterium]|nr:DUF1330 domain-containing protein [Gammaproteobacteria bacterium]